MSNFPGISEVINDDSERLLLIQVNFDNFIVLPLEDGLDLLKVLKKARFILGYGSSAKLTATNQTLSFRIITEREIKESLVSTALG